MPVTSAAAGSGFVITADGYIVTNYHVIEDANSHHRSPLWTAPPMTPTLVGGEEDNDIAVLEDRRHRPHPRHHRATPTTSGWARQVVAIGNPLGELTYSLTSGIISARDRCHHHGGTVEVDEHAPDRHRHQLRATPAAPSSTCTVEVIGITTAKLSGSSSAKLSGSSSSSATIEGLGFAIPINDVKDMISDIIENGYVTGKPYIAIRNSTK